MLYRTKRIVESVLAAEGGYWNDPIGGPTNFGIRQVTLDALRSKYPYLPASVEDLTRDDAAVLIEREYVVGRNIHLLPEHTALVQAHMCVLSWNDGIEIMQKRLGVTVDGLVGPASIKAAYQNDVVQELRGNLSDIREFLKTRTNGFSSSYEKRFANLFA